MPHRYTPEQHAWMREHYPRMTNAELAEAFAARFGAGVTASTMRAYGSNHGLRKDAGVRERALRSYTDEENEWLRGYIPGHSEREIIDAFAERFGRRLDRCQVNNRKHKLGVQSGTVGGQFRRGQEPPNKGKRWCEFMSPEGQERSRATTFKAGERHGAAAERVRPLLDIRETKDGYLQIKVAPRSQPNTMRAWISLAEFEWMAANGREWPEGHRAVFADGDRRNLDPDNIVPVPGDLYAIVTGGAHGAAMEWHDRATLEVAITHARVMRERRRLELASHTCRRCGRTFDARYPRQRTCDECLGRTGSDDSAPRRPRNHAND